MQTKLCGNMKREREGAELEPLRIFLFMVGGAKSALELVHPV